ncbi:MAG TPA: helix-turn-helix domain-containing protein [Steroidobacteraceae bacterium]|nr:helix-turn-helix domain-containing protein [Steroidobacteraceae bacterium]
MPTRKFFCPINVTLSLINSKWKPFILFLLKGRARRFSELQAALPNVSHKVLTQQLRALERDQLIERANDLQANIVAYRMTEFGKTLRPALTALAAWGTKHHKAIGCDLIWPPDRPLSTTRSR